MNRVQGARRAPWTRFMNAPATAFGLLPRQVSLPLAGPVFATEKRQVLVSP
jgi:hypothetical protein